MKKTAIFTPFIILTLIAPLALGGTPTEPESIDESGDAHVGGVYVPALDITSAWFTSVEITASTQTLPGTALTFQLADIGTGSPLADDADGNTHYYYRADFEVDGAPLFVQCYVSLVPSPQAIGTGGIGAGTFCQRSEGSAPPKGEADLLNDRFVMTFPNAQENGVVLGNVVLTTWTQSLPSLVKSASPTDTAYAGDFVVGS
jgi:hypothetical protein